MKQFFAYAFAVFVVLVIGGAISFIIGGGIGLIAGLVLGVLAGNRAFILVTGTSPKEFHPFGKKKE